MESNSSSMASRRTEECTNLFGCVSLQSRLVGINPVQIKATMELYPDIRPTHRPSGQEVPAGECYFSNMSPQPRIFIGNLLSRVFQIVNVAWLKKSMGPLVPGLYTKQTNRTKGMQAVSYSEGTCNF